MPRQDVPYGGAICRLRERIAEIFDKLGEKLHTINGVPGDGDGNVKIVSGSSAVVINNDPTQNEIAVSLDTSQLPAAAVSSVNGQTGAVALDAGDIPSDGNSDVQSDIDALQTMDGALQGNINAEALARQGADATLQTNINTLSASLPSAAAAAVAADPTVAYINTELNNKVDLSDVSTVETPDTIAKRNGSGRLVAADPASGATDKTLVNANWISQSGSGAPNNVLHTIGNETKNGILSNDYYFNGFQYGCFINQPFTSSSRWIKAFKLQRQRTYQLTIIRSFPWNNRALTKHDVLLTLPYQNLNSTRILVRSMGASNPTAAAETVKLAYDNNTSEMFLFLQQTSNTFIYAEINNAFYSTGVPENTSIVECINTIDIDPSTDTNYTVFTGVND